MKQKIIDLHHNLTTRNLTLNRPFLLGVAIIMVIIYHFFSWTINPFGRFNIGYIGVDIFLFLSGWGLSYSYKKNDIKTFYIRRIKKIVPLYLLTSIIIIAISTNNENINIIEALKRISTISFYINPDNSIDWYLNSLFIFYLTFPILYKICNKLKFKAIIVFIIITIIIYGTTWYYDIPIHWKYDCFLARIPIFCAGIVYAIHQYTPKQIIKTAYICLLMYFPFYYVSSFLAASTLVLGIAIYSTLFSPNNIGHIYNKIEFLGKYTLELYCANIITLAIFINFITQTDTTSRICTKIILYIPLQTILSCILIKINKFFQR